MKSFGLRGCGWLSLLLAAVQTTVACGNATDDPKLRPSNPGSAGAYGNSPQTLAEFEQRFAESYCQSIAACCSRQGFASTACNTTLREQVRAQLQSSATNPKIHFNPDAGAACIDAYATALQACTDRASFTATDSACERVFEGTVPVGGECGRSAECAPPAHGSVSCTTGVCELGTNPSSARSAPHRQLGEACAGSCESSGGYATCSGSSSGLDPELGSCWLEDGLLCESDVCVRAPLAGEACSSWGYCASTAHCVNKVCIANQSSGPCTQDSECLQPTVCDDTLKTCHPRKANGEPCDTADECQGGQCHEDHCRTWTVADTGACLGVLDD